MGTPPDKPQGRFPPRRLVLLLGVAAGAFYAFDGVTPLLAGQRGADVTQAVFGAAIMLPCAYMFWRYHAG